MLQYLQKAYIYNHANYELGKLQTNSLLKIIHLRSQTNKESFSFYFSSI